jgi:hypothetical protein
LDHGGGVINLAMLSVPVTLTLTRTAHELTTKVPTPPGQAPGFDLTGASEAVCHDISATAKVCGTAPSGRLRRASAIAAAANVNAVLKHFEGPDQEDTPNSPSIATLLSPANIGSATSGSKRRRTADTHLIALESSSTKRSRTGSKKQVATNREDDFVDLLTDSDTEVVHLASHPPVVADVDVCCASPKLASPLHVHDCVNVPPFGWGNVETISRSTVEGGTVQYTIKLWCGAILHTFDHYLQATQSHRAANEDKIGRYAGVPYVASDVYRLCEGVYLNDTLVDIGIARHAATLPIPVQLAIRCAGTFAMALMARDLAALLDDAKKHQALTAASASTRLFGNDMDPFQRLFTCFPFNDNNHWSIAVICYPAMLFGPRTPRTQATGTFSDSPLYHEDDEPAASASYSVVGGSPSELRIQQLSKVPQAAGGKRTALRRVEGTHSAKGVCALTLLTHQVAALAHHLDPIPMSILGTDALLHIQELLDTAGLCCAPDMRALHSTSEWDVMHAADLVMTAQPDHMCLSQADKASALSTFRCMRTHAAALDKVAQSTAEELQRIAAEHRRVIERKAAEFAVPSEEAENIIHMDNRAKREAAYARTLRLAAIHGSRRAAVLLSPEAKEKVAAMRAMDVRRIDIKLQALELRLSLELRRAAAAKSAGLILRHKMVYVRKECDAVESKLKLLYFSYAAKRDTAATPSGCTCSGSSEVELRLLHFMIELHTMVLQRLAEVHRLVVMMTEEATDNLQPLRQEKSELQQDLKTAIKLQSGLQKHFVEIEMRATEPPVPCILFLDSLKFHRVQNVTRTLRQYLEYMSRLHYSDGTAADAPIVVDASTMVAAQPEDMPRQDNDCDCGMFIIEYFKHFSTPLLPHVTHKDVSDKLRQVIPEDWFDNTGIGASRQEFMSWMIHSLPQRAFSQFATLDNSASDCSS